MSELQNGKSKIRVRPSPQNEHNRLNINDLGDSHLKNGTVTGHFFSLYDTISELCKEKKIMFFKPTAYIEFIPPRLTQGKEWYVSYYVRNPETGKMKRFRVKVNRYKTTKEKKEAARAICARLTEKLSLGWNPILENVAPKADSLFFEAMDKYLSVKTKEMEENSIRSYVSYVKIIKTWLLKNGYSDKMYSGMFTHSVAQAFMDSAEDDEKISPRTWNNRLSFYKNMFNWLVEKGYAADNVFRELKKKPKKLTKKKRQILSEEELATLIAWLKENNPEYLAACMLCYCCFMRPKEISLLKCRDVDLKSQTVYVSSEIAKNDNDSIRTIPDSMMPYMRGLDYSNPDWYLFADHKNYDFKPGKKPVCSRKLARYWSDFVRPGCHFPMELQFYSLKDTGITNMLGSGVPVSFVKQQADHSSLAMTSIYLGKLKGRANEALKGIDIIK